ncbi:hypothetical protein [Hydrogenophaga sp.]|uniref:hypothetical protein n=1 Tax=Hydrogenophaga sp. TaxID=1904254 RepID=UPI00261C8557|nr:hypothetical protein [Hydrogenophaga sp.]MDM7948113.1 hypothetical protein [Hydrogenophaga sp.]
MFRDPPPNTLVLEGFDETFTLPVKDAVYCILPDGRFSMSIESENHPLMGEAVFTFERVSIPGGLATGAVLSVPYPQGERESFDEASTHLYFGTHDDPREALVEVVALTQGVLAVVGQFLWHESYAPELGGMRYAKGRFKAACRRGTHEELRVLM